MLEFLRKSFRSEDTGEETGTYPDAILQMTELQKACVNAREHGHQSFVRDYGMSREVYRRSMGFA